MPNYTKLFNSIITSTIWTEDDKTRIMWITMLAMADKNGEVHASIPGMARVSGMAVSDAEKAMDKLLSPDPYSRTPDNDGRRIVPIDGGWELLNHAKYRAMASKEDAKTANAERVRRHRERKNALECNENVTVRNGNVTLCNGDVTVDRDIAEAEADTDLNKTKSKRVAFTAPSLSEVDEYGKTLTPKFIKAQNFIDFYESNGWKVGKNPMKSWRAAVRTWNAKEKGQPTTAAQMGLSGINSVANYKV